MAVASPLPVEQLAPTFVGTGLAPPARRVLPPRIRTPRPCSGAALCDPCPHNHRVLNSAVAPASRRRFPTIDSQLPARSNRPLSTCNRRVLTLLPL